jgi:Helix-turn-helix domain
MDLQAAIQALAERLATLESAQHQRVFNQMETARELNMSVKKLRELQKAGLIRATLNGRNWMFTSQELERYARGEPPP